MQFVEVMHAGSDVSWAITPEKVEAVVRRLVELADPVRIVLFGSYVRGTVHPDSDLDVLVVTDDARVRPRAESIRLRRALRDINMPMDILVVSHADLDRLRHRWDLVYHEACETGKIVYERGTRTE